MDATTKCGGSGAREEAAGGHDVSAAGGFDARRRWMLAAEIALAVAMGLAMAGCAASRANDHSIDKQGVTHDRAYMEIDFYLAGQRHVSGLDIGDTATTSHVRIAEQNQTTSLQEILELVRALRVPPTQP